MNFETYSLALTLRLSKFKNLSGDDTAEVALIELGLLEDSMETEEEARQSLEHGAMVLVEVWYKHTRSTTTKTTDTTTDTRGCSFSMAAR